MAQIIYGHKISSKHADTMDETKIAEALQDAIVINHCLVKDDKKIAYFFIDPLLNAFEAGNHFYFSILECKTVEKLTCYRSGAGPIQALRDAQEIIDHHLYDAVFIFGYEPLLTNKTKFGKATIQQAMDIFNGPSVLSCYNELGHIFCAELGISFEDFDYLSDCLYQNYCHSFPDTSDSKFIDTEREAKLSAIGGDLFCLSDCANPNLDFAGGIIVTSDAISDFLGISLADRLEIIAVKTAIVEGHPNNLKSIHGQINDLFPHLREVFIQIQQASGIDIRSEFFQHKLLLDLYTCYPPVPLLFLLASQFAKTISDLPSLLHDYAVTITGGLSLAGAPWNNPALNSLITLFQQLPYSPAQYGLIHGNGGIGEIQGLALLGKWDA